MRLRVTAGADRGKDVPLSDGCSIAVGRGADVDFKLNDPSISRRHLVIEQADGQWRLTDLQSLSGTRVNGTWVQKCPLQPGDRIRIGLTELQFGGDAPPPPAVRRPPAQKGSLFNWIFWIGMAVGIAAVLLVLFFLPEGTYFVMHRDDDGSVKRIEFVPDGKPKLEKGQKLRSFW